MIVARLALAGLFALGATVVRAEPPPEPPIDVFLFIADWRTTDGEVVVFDDLAKVPPALVPPPPARGADEPTRPEAPDAEPPEDVRALLSAEPKRWERFSPEERARAIAGARLWSTFSDRDRRHWRGRFTRWYSLSPEERAELRARFSWWNRLSQDERREIAAAAAPPAAFPRHRGKELDPALRSALRDLPRDERRALERKLRTMDEEERQRYVREELGL